MLPFHLANLLSIWLPSRTFRLRRLLFRASGCAIDPTVKLTSGVCISGNNVVIESGTWLSPECRLFSTRQARITIRNSCDIGHGVWFVTGSHEIGGPGRRAGAGYSLPIEIGPGCWIGARSIVLGGVQIGPGCVVAAGSVVRGGVYRSQSLIAGVPAKVKRLLDES